MCIRDRKREPRKGQIHIDIGQIHASKRDFKAAEESFNLRPVLRIEASLLALWLPHQDIIANQIGLAEVVSLLMV